MTTRTAIGLTVVLATLAALVVSQSQKQMALSDNLIAFWELEEASGNAIDAHSGGHDLTENGGTIGTATGVVGSGRDLEASGSQYFTIADNADLSTGNIDFYGHCWIKLESIPGTMVVCGKWRFSGSNQREWLVQVISSRIRLAVSSTGTGASATVTATSFGTLSTGTWYFVEWWHDATNDIIGVAVNGTSNTTSYSSGVFDSSADFTVGAYDVQATPDQFLDGVVDQLGFWKRVPDSTDRAAFYNSGSGVSYSDIVGVADSIAVSTPVAYQTYQRNGSDQADIAITGTYTGTPAAIEASFNGGAYATIDASPSAGTFSGTLSNQAAGQGTLTVRFTDDTGVTDTVANVGIGDVFLVAGQSNASGRATNNQSYSHATLKATMFRESGSWAELADPTDSDDAGVGGSAWPLLATLLMDQEGVPVAFITAAQGATGLVAPDADWTKGGADYNAAVSRVSASAVNDLKAILFYQGERDAVNGTSQAAYQTALSQMLDDFQTDLGFASVPLVAAQIAEYSSLTAADLDPIRLAIANRWDNDADIYPGPVTYDVDLSDGTGDGVHFKTDAEMTTLANRWWAAIDAAVYGGTERGPKLSSATFDGSTTITLTFDKNLATGGPYTGFQAYDDAVEATITSATRTSATTIEIELSAPASGTVTVSLGSGNEGAGATVPTGEAISLPTTGTINLPAEPFVGVEAAGGGGGGARTTKNTRSHPLGVGIGMNWRVSGCV